MDAEVVVHVAGRIVPALSNLQPAQDIAENLVGSVRLLDLCVQARVKAFIFASSGGTIYGPRAASLVSEDDPTDPISSYGVIKLAFEKYLDMYYRAHGLHAVSLRIGNAYGQGQRVGLQGLVARAIDSAIGDRPMEIWGDGSAIRDYIHIDDVVAAFLRAATLDPAADVPRLYNIGSGVGRSVRQVIATVESIHGRPLAVTYGPANRWDVSRVVLDITRAQQMLGWTPQRGWEEGVRDTYQSISRELVRA
jgi:UDP-glucose 4-epimerase